MIIYEKINSTKKIITTLHSTYLRDTNNYTIEAEIEWHASEFFAEIILGSKEQRKSLDLKWFKQFLKDYNSENGTSFTTSFFINKHWVRYVLNQIKLPSAIRSYLYQFRKNHDRYNELKFLYDLVIKYPDPELGQRNDGNLNSVSFEEEMISFEKKNDIVLNRKWLEDSNFCKINGYGNIVLKNIEYYKTMVENWSAFDCLSSLKEQVDQASDFGLKISKPILSKIVKQHRKNYPESPTLNSFKKSQIIKVIDNQYEINVHNSPLSFEGDFLNKIGTYIWRSICKENGSSEEKVLRFLNVFIFLEILPDLNDHLTSKEREAFVSGALQLLNKEKDLSPLKEEVQKAILDEGFTSSGHILGTGIYRNILPLKPKDTYYEMYQQLTAFSKNLSLNLFEVEECRNSLHYLITQLIEMDVLSHNKPFGGQSREKSNIIALMRNGFEKPYLLKNTIDYITRVKPELLPELVAETDFASIAVAQSYPLNIDFPIDDFRNEIQDKITLALVEIGLKKLCEKGNLDQIAKYLFDCYLFIIEEKFQNNNARTIEQFEINEKRILEKEDKLKHIFENCTINGDPQTSTSQPLLLNKIFEKLIKIFGLFEDDPYFNNGVLRFPAIAIDGLSWIAKCALLSKFNLNQKEADEIKKCWNKAFKKLYLNNINAVNAIRKNIVGEDTEQENPSWYAPTDAIKKINWAPIAFMLDKEDRWDEFLAINFNLKSDDELEEYQKLFLNVDKFRTHLLVLVQTIFDINKNSKTFMISIGDQETIIDQTERRIIRILELNAKDTDIDEGKNEHQWIKNRKNLLSTDNERDIMGREDKALMPLIIDIANHSDNNKEAFFKAIIKKAGLIRLLSVLNNTNFLSIKEKCIKAIISQNISNNLVPLSRDKVVLVISELSKNSELSSCTQEALEYWDDNVHKDHLQLKEIQDIFEARLNLAFHLRDLKMLDDIKLDKEIYRIHSNLKPDHHKLFFKALILFVNKSLKESYKIFDQLYSIYPTIPTFALNRFAAKLELGIKDQSKQLVEESLKQWNQIESSISLDKFPGLNEKLTENKLIAYKFLNMEKAYDDLYSSFSNDLRLKPEIISIHKDYLIGKGKTSEANNLELEGVNYHGLKMNTNIAEQGLLTDLGHDNTIKSMQNTINQVCMAPADIFAQILNNDPTKSTNIGYYLMDRIIDVANLYLLKIKSIRKLHLEDSYTDIVEMGLKLSLCTWGFSIHSQSTGGSSASKKSTGERDLVIARGINEIAVFEALIYKSKSTLQAHMTKIFNYTHNREQYYIMVYDDDSNFNGFEKRWQKYWYREIPKLIYPKGFNYNSAETKDVSMDLKLQSTSIRAGISKHGNSTTIYHIYVGLNYEI